MLLNLPFELFYELREFANINALFDTCKKLKTIGNKTIRTRTLNEKGALKYLKDEKIGRAHV